MIGLEYREGTLSDWMTEKASKILTHTLHLRHIKVQTFRDTCTDAHEQRYQSRNANMRMHTLLSITLLGLLLWASCIRADDTDAKQTETQEDASRETTEENPGEEEDTKEPPKKEKTTEIEEEKDVMVLHINNFARALSENQYLLVEFCK